jgi:curli biogenesis system outer membrane secretion channel CsgG
MRTSSKLVGTLLMVMTLAGALGATDDPQPRPTLAIVDFETTPAGSVLPPPHLGSALAGLMLDRLVASGKYRVLDGRWLRIGRAEDGFINTESAREYAESAGVDYLVLGSMTQFSAESRRRTYGGGLVVPLLAGVRRNRVELVVGITVRVVDVRSGEVATTATSQGMSERKGVKIGALGLFSHGGGGGFSNESTGSRDAQLSEAVARAVATAAQGVINAGSRLKAQGSGRTD